MNCTFETVGQAERDGIVYNVQQADVTDNPRFWAEWNHAKKMKADAERLNADTLENDMTSVIRLVRKLVDGRLRWIAARMIPQDSALPLYTFKQSFTLRDTKYLLPYQIPAVYYLCNAVVNHRAAADGSDTGIGKTYQALGVCRNLVLRPGIICRKAGIAGWQRACSYMQIDPLFITNWEQAKTGRFPFVEKYTGRDRYHFRWRVPKGSILIFDEAHMGAVEGTQNNLLWLSSKGIASLSLSATFSDRASRLKSLLWLLGVVSSRDEYEHWLMTRGHYINRREKIESLDDIDDLLEINRVLYPRYGCRISYNDPEVKKMFPKAVYQTEIMSISQSNTTKQNKLYNDLLVKVEKYKELGKNAEVINADMRYRQAAELLKAPTVADMARNLLDQGASVLIFVNYRETLAWFMKRFRRNYGIFGDQDRFGIPRDRLIDEFQSNRIRLLFLMEQAGGQSISLHDIHGGHPRVSLIFPTYDPIVLKQVLGRTYRAKAKSTPVMKLVYAANTVEEKVADKVNRKLANISALHDGDLMEPDLFNMGV